LSFLKYSKSDAIKNLEKLIIKIAELPQCSEVKTAMNHIDKAIEAINAIPKEK